MILICPSKRKIKKVCLLFRHERDQSFLVPVPARKKFWSQFRWEKVLGLGPGPFRNKFSCRSQSKIFWSRFRRDRDHFVHLHYYYQKQAQFTLEPKSVERTPFLRIVVSEFWIFRLKE